MTNPRDKCWSLMIAVKPAQDLDRSTAMRRAHDRTDGAKDQPVPARSKLTAAALHTHPQFVSTSKGNP
jgi:hypothetical protein